MYATEREEYLIFKTIAVIYLKNIPENWFNLTLKEQEQFIKENVNDNFKHYDASYLNHTIFRKLDDFLSTYIYMLKEREKMKTKDVITKLQTKHCLNCNCRIEDEEGNAICGEFEQRIENVTSCLNWHESTHIKELKKGEKNESKEC